MKLSLKWKALVIWPKTWLAFWATWAQCLDGLRLSVNSTPTSFSSVELIIGILFMVYWWFGLFLPKCIILHLPTLNFTDHLSAHSLSLSIAVRISELSVGDLIILAPLYHQQIWIKLLVFLYHLPVGLCKWQSPADLADWLIDYWIFGLVKTWLFKD